jgi:hypothetical protein
MAVSGSSTTKPSTLPASARASGVEIQITNEDTDDWENVEIHVNTDSIGMGGYEGHVNSLDRGETATFPLVTLTDRQGRRFQPLAQAPIRIRIDATTRRARETALLNFK